MEKAVNPLQQLFLLALLQKQAEIEEAKALLSDFVYLAYLSEIGKVEIEKEPLNYTDPTGLASEDVIDTTRTLARWLIGNPIAAYLTQNSWSK